jgi:hypothetical protein
MCFKKITIVWSEDIDMNEETGKQNTCNWDEILESNNEIDQERQNQKCTHQKRAQDGRYNRTEKYYSITFFTWNFLNLYLNTIWLP